MRSKTGLALILAIVTIGVLTGFIYYQSHGGTGRSDFKTIAVDCATGTGYIDAHGEPRCRT